MSSAADLSAPDAQPLTAAELAPIAAAELEPDGITPASGNKLYTRKSYWQLRFEREASKDWLCSWAELSPLLSPLLQKSAALLLVGSGNSALPAELAAAGFSDILATDYAENVVARMAAAAAGSPAVRWACADMRALGLPPAAFDAVLDKATMDALLADGGDAWPITQAINSPKAT